MLMGSPDGVITATRMQMPTMANRRADRRLSGLMIPAICRKISRIGNSKPMPKASIM
jgi:hypothetical protein